MENIVATGVIIAIVNAVKIQWKQVKGLYAVLLAVVLGAVAGYFSFGGVVGVENGILVGLFASGVYKVVVDRK
uniref:Uncharacterized protein n=1 Tax=viral metagenome TaxID=1070528 RepID=A0A6M3JGB0_9ZZZZ